jgi:hypothetical protein
MAATARQNELKKKLKEEEKERAEAESQRKEKEGLLRQSTLALLGNFYYLILDYSLLNFILFHLSLLIFCRSC